MLLGEKKPKEEVHQKQRLGCTNFDLDNIVMLVDVKKLEQLLVKSEYNQEETRFLVKGFTEERYASPYESIPFKEYIQSLIRLVPKAGGKTRQIFHLSYNFKNGNKSVNLHTPKEICSVKYQDLDFAMRLALRFIRNGAMSMRFTKTDLRSAFRILPLKLRSFR